MTDEQRRYYFMAGLPRSGSTLLSAILNQNPKFYSGPSSPVTGLMLMLEQYLSQDELFRAYPKVEQAGNLISNVINHYYSDIDKPVIFDKNRSWVNRIHYIPGYFGCEAKILCPVRNISEILASFIAMHRRNPHEINGKINFIDEMLVKTNTPLTDDNRCEFLASQNGILGQSYFGIRQALAEGYQKNIHFIEYKDLVNNPKETMIKIYEFLDEEYYEHDFENVVNINKEEDVSVYGFADMHDVRQSVSHSGIDPKEILSESTLSKCANSEFWRSLADYVDFDMQSDESSEESQYIDYGNDDTQIIGS